MYLQNYHELLEKIPGDKPAGEPLDFVIKTRLDDDRKEIDPNLYDEKDPQRPESPKFADWKDIVDLASRTLMNQTKDFNLAVRLVEAVTRLDGFPGLARALQFLLAYTQQCWDVSYPLVESEEDLETRAGPFHWLSEPERGSRFPTTIRFLPIVEADQKQVNVLDWANSRKPDASFTFDDINRLISGMSPQLAEINLNALNESVETIQQLQTTLDDYMGPYSPSLVGLRAAIQECQGIATGIAEKLVPQHASGDQAGNEISGDVSDAAAGDAAGKTGPTWNPQNAVAARKAIYDQLRNNADLLIQLEPHSPIPYLIRKAVSLGELTYPQLMARLVEDSSVLSQIRKELGLPEE